jgi:general secretion pathway protein I
MRRAPQPLPAVRGGTRLRGFTLIEVVVALVIVAFGMSAVLAALSSSANNTAALRERALAEWLALNRLTTLRLATASPSDGNTEGDVDSYANSPWHWRQTVEDLDVPGVKRLTIQVRRVTSNETAAAKTSWLATVVGFRGEAVARPNGEQPDWTGNSFASSGTPGGNTGGTGGTGAIRNPGTPQPGLEGQPSTGAPAPPGGAPPPPPAVPAVPGTGAGGG